MRQYHLASFADRPSGKAKVCRTFDADFAVTLYQRGRDHFAVQYGMQVDDDLPYADAARKLGEALMHAMACEGQLDNREARS